MESLISLVNKIQRACTTLGDHGEGSSLSTLWDSLPAIAVVGGQASLGVETKLNRHKTRLHIGQLVKDTSAKLKEVSETDHHQDVSKSKKIADAKLAKDFEAVLKEFQKAHRIAAERENTYAPFDPKGSLSSSEVEIGYDNRSQEQGIQEVQQQIGEVNEIFKDLAVLVHDQGAMIDDIGSHVENAYSSTAQGKSHLVKASKTQRSNSSLVK